MTSGRRFVTTLERQMAFYMRYHRDPRNKATHFVGGWILQLIGHWFEGKRPALVDNIWQIFVAPLFLMVEALAPLGFKRDLLRRAEELAAR
jgi:uncharacterized membrane protein YGL010W